MEILIIADWFSPENIIAAVRPTKLYKYWKKLGHKVTVLIREKFILMDDNISDNINQDDIIRVNTETIINKIIGKGKKNFGVKQNMPEVVKKGFKIKLRDKLVQINMRFRYKKFYSKSKRIIKRLDKQFDLIFSTHVPIVCHEIANYAKKMNPGAFWIADFRDPPIETETVHASGKKKDINLAGKKCKNADLVTAVSRGCLDELFLPKTFKSCVVTNGFDKEDFASIVKTKDNSLFKISYTGALVFAGRKFSVFFKALSELITENKIDKSKLELHCVGWRSENFLVQAQEYNLDAVVRGVVSKKDALSLQQSSQILLLASWNTSTRKGVLTGKLFEYMAAEKPVIALIEGDVPNSETKEIIERTQIGFCYERATDNFQELKDYIYSLYKEWIGSGRLCYNANVAEVEKYNYKNIAEQMLQLVETEKKK